MPERQAFFLNFRRKIGKYQAELGFSTEQIAEMQTLADDFMASYSWVISCEATMKAAFAWRDSLYEMPSPDAGASEAPVFPVPPVVNGGKGIIERMYKFRRQIVASGGYSESIGADLGIIGAVEQPLRTAQLSPTLKISTAQGRNVFIGGSMKKMPAIMIEYKPEHGEWIRAAFLQNLPTTINLPADDPAIAERGTVRAVYFQKNEQCGNYSAEYPVVLYQIAPRPRGNVIS